MTTTKKVSELVELTSAENSDVLLINDVSAAQTKKIAVSNLFNGTVLTVTGSFKGDLDGTASNADLLDNLDSTAFAKLVAANVFTGNQIVTGSITATANLSAAKLGSKTLLVVEGGAYNTIQEAIDAASDNDVVLVGPKASGGSWGPVVFASNKRLVVASLLSKWSTQVKVDSVTFDVQAPGVGQSILNSTVFVRGLFISSSFTAAAPGVKFSGSSPGRMRLQECFIYNTNSATGTGVVSNNSGTGSSLYLDNCVVQSGWSTGIGVDHQQGYTNIRNDSEISRFQYPIQCAAGNVEILSSVIDGTGIANEVVRVSGGVVTCGYSTIKNTTTNATGINLTTAGAFFGMGDATFAIGTGTGHCVNGVAGTYYLYGNVTYSHSAASGAWPGVAYNVRVKNSAGGAGGVTAVAVSQAFTGV